MPGRKPLSPKQLQITDVARADIREIIGYLASEAGTDIAESFLHRIDAELTTLAKALNPDIFPGGLAAPTHTCGGSVFALEDPKQQSATMGAPRSIKLDVDRWYALEIRTKLNDVGKQNGILQIWIDDRLVSDLNNVVYRTSDNPHLKVGKLGMYIHRGGGSAKFAGVRDEDIFMDNLVLATTKIGRYRGTPSVPVPANAAIGSRHNRSGALP